MANISAYYVDSNTFIVSGSGDQTDIFHAGRRVQAYCGPDGFKYGTIESSSYAAPNNTINLTSGSDALTSNLLSVKYGIVSDTPSGSLPVHDHSSDQGEGGTLDVYSQSEVDTLTQEASANAYQQVVNDDYMPVDASKAFTAPVSGQDPTLDNHLATQSYVQSQIPSGAGATDFLELDDTPSDYTGDSLKLLRVNLGETGVEFVPSAGLATEDYVDTEVASVSAASDEADNAVEASANAYTDTQITSVSAAADEGDNATLASANTYSDSASANAETQANAYTDTQVESVSAAADEGDNATLASAQTYSEEASANALTQSWVFDPTPDSDHDWSGEWTTMTVDVNATGFGAALYMASDGNFEEADADASTTMPCKALALEAGTGSKKVLFRGFVRDDTWNWTPGGLLYVSTTAGALTQTAPSATGDQVQVVGFATHADRIFFNPDYTIVEVA